jgi:hypothetical protein
VSALLAMWTNEIDSAMARMRQELSFHFWCPTDVLKALHHIHVQANSYERTSTLEGRVNYWDRARRLGRVAESFDIEAQILSEIGRRA